MKGLKEAWTIVRKFYHQTQWSYKILYCTKSTKGMYSYVSAHNVSLQNITLKNIYIYNRFQTNKKQNIPQNVFYHYLCKGKGAWHLLPLIVQCSPNWSITYTSM